MFRFICTWGMIASGFNSLAAATLPDIVVFLADDHGQADSGPYGSPDARTPNIEKLASEGMTFTQAFVASPSCAPSRTAMLTGLMPARNGAEANHTFKRDEIASLPPLLKKLGYETAVFGKVAHGKHDVKRHGFDHFNMNHQASVVDQYLDARDKSKPLCLFVGTHSPHVPWPENKGFDPAKIQLPASSVDTPETRVQRARYLSGVADADKDLGEILAVVEKYTSRDNTLTIYTADHGAQWPFGKWNLYDSGIRVPFIARWPGTIAPGSRTEAQIQWIDLWPTIIDIGGGKTPDDIDGRSFAAVLKGTKTSHRTEIFSTQSGDGDKNVYPIRSLRADGFKYILNLYPQHAHTTHIDRGGGSGDGWLYFDEWVAAAKVDPKAAARVSAYHRRPAEELYDLASDPSELNNLASDPRFAERVSTMRKRLDDWMVSQGDRRKIFNEPHPFDEPYPERNK